MAFSLNVAPSFHSPFLKVLGFLTNDWITIPMLMCLQCKDVLLLYVLIKNNAQDEGPNEKPCHKAEAPKGYRGQQEISPSHTEKEPKHFARLGHGTGGKRVKTHV